MNDKRGLRYACDYLKAFMPIRLVTDTLYRRAGCTGKVESLGHSLRREARRPNPRVNVSYTPDESGKDIAYYTYNTEHNNPAPRTVHNVPRRYFYTLSNTKVPSPYFEDLSALVRDLEYKFGDMAKLPHYYVWCGDHESAILVEGKL